MNLIAEQIVATIRDGGSTYLIQGNMAETDNIAVSIFPDYSQVVMGHVTYKQLSDFYQSHKLILKKYPELAVGTWYENNLTYIDLVILVRDRDKAVALGRRYNQKAVFDLTTMEEIETGGTGKVLELFPTIEERINEARHD